MCGRKRTFVVLPRRDDGDRCGVLSLEIDKSKHTTLRGSGLLSIASFEIRNNFSIDICFRVPIDFGAGQSLDRSGEPFLAGRERCKKLRPSGRRFV